MEESDDNVSSEDMNCITSPSLKTKPKKRSLVERELETSLTAKITSPISYGEATSTSRYGRARRLKNDVGITDIEKTDLKLSVTHNDMSPTRALSAYKMHASNSPIRTESVKDDLDNQIENIYNENISLSRFGSEEKKSRQSNSKIYIRKDLIQTKDKEETIVLIKNMFSPDRGNISNSDLSKSSEKYNKKHKEDLSSVVKALDFGGKKKKKETQEKRMSQSDLFNLEAQCGYQVGDLTWARMGTYPFWPSIVTREPTSLMFIKKKLIGRLEKDIIHVTFLGDNGRRGWILESMLRKYMGLQEFQFARENFTPEAKKRDPRLYAAFFISEKRQPLWHLSVEEAEVLLKEPKRLRIDILHAMLSKGKDAKEIPVKSKKVVRTNSDVSLSESLYDSLFSEDDCKNSDTECSRSKARNKSFDVSDVVTACLDNMAAKTGITKIQKQSHMDIWLQKAKSKTPEKCQYIQTKCEKKTKINTKIKVSSRNKNYRLRNQSIESQGERDIEIKLLSHQSEHDYIQSAFTNGHIVDDIDLGDSGSNLSDPGSELSSLSIQENTSTTLYNSVPDNEAKGILTEVTDENCTEIEVITNEDITVESCDINELLIRSERENCGKNNEEAICSDNLSTKSSLIDDFAEENKVNVNQQNPETPQENESVISTNVQIIDNESSRKDETIEMLNKNVSNPLPIKIVNKCVEDTQSNDKSNLYCTDEAVKILNGNVVHTILFADNDKSINENTIHNTTNDVSDLSTTDETVKILENVITNSVQKENENSKINHDKNNESASDSNLKDNSSKIPNNCQTTTIFLALAQDDNIANEIIRNKDYNTMSDVSVTFDKHDIIKEQNKNIDSNYSPNEVIHKNILFTQNKYNEKKTSITEQMKDHVGNLILDEQNEGIRENDVSAKNENLLIDDNIQKNCQSVITEFNTEDSCDISLIYEHNSNEGDLNKSNVSKGHLNLISESMSSIGSHCAIINKDVENLTVKRSNLISMETQKIDIMSEHDEKKETDHSNINGENCQEVNEDVTDTRGNPAESYKSKSPSDSVNGLKNIEFLKYFEQKQDSVIDENPELTDDEVKAYLYKTWQYEESLKSERKILDDIEQSKLVKGLDQPAPEKKYRKKTLRLKSEKSKQTLINFKVVPKDMKTERKQHSLRNDLNSDVTLNSDLNESTAQKEILHNDLINVQTDKNKRDNIPMSHKENIVKLAEESKNHLINDLKNNSSEKILNAHIIPETNSQNIEITKSSVNENEKIKSSYNSNSENEFAIENNSKQVNSKEEVESENCRIENYFDLTLDSDSNDNSSTKKISLNINKKYIENNSNIHCNSKDTIDKDHSKDLTIKNYEKCIDLQYVDVNIINNEYIDSTSECEIRETACSRASTLSSEDFIKKKDDLDVISIKSGESEISLSKRKTRKEKHPPNKTYLENPEFLKYLELRQDELIDENPQLTQEEITTYLYNTWSYEENMKSENKKSDDLDQRNLVKGLNDDPVSVKRIRKKVKVDKEKDYSGNYEEVISKDKSKRRTERQFYREDYSDYEDELEMYQIFKSESSVKAEPENAVIDETNEKVFVNKVENTEATVVEEEITEHVDQVEEYFRKLTEPKPNLFKGLVREKVCEICEKIGNLVKCKGCYGMFHVDCTKKIVELKESPLPVRGRKKKRKNRGRKPKGLDDSYEEHSDDRSQDRDMSLEYEPESYTIANADEFEQKLSAKLKEMIENPETKYDTHSSDEELNWSDADVGKCQVVDIVPKKKTTEITNFKCKNCEEYDIPVCFVCKGAISPKNQIEHRQKCQIAHCNKYYHLECLEHWPQTHLSTGERSKKGTEFLESLSCPRHVCHTCVCDDPRGCKTRFSGDKLARCVRCPATYHSFTKCLPAGTQILTGSHVVCPRHYEHRPGKVPCHVNTGWCFICALGGSLICCEYCPTSFHAECLNIEPPEGGYMCEDCETGCLPLYGEMVWVKLGHYRWWPGLILHPSEIPENILAVKHYPGEYVVRFFGQYDHYWVNRGRVFPFQEGDTGRVSSKNSKIDAAFSMAVQHAQRAYEILKNESPSNEGDEDIASSLLPPRYVKLKVNKPCGSLVHRRADPEEGSLAQCECAPDDGEPCGPYSHCLNRMLLTECGPTCRAGERCSNRAFERRQYPRMEPYRTAARGWGLRTLEDIRAGQFVIEYVGELIDEEEFQRRMRWKHEVRDENYYFLTLDKERMIDAGPKGNLARFMNHSCDPNCETQKWTVLGDVRVGLFALHDIPAKSELTFNYNLECAGIDKKRCMCGARRCSGFMGAKPKQEEPKKSKMAAKRTYKKRKPIELSPSTSYNKPKRGRPRLRELTDIERDLLIITSASNGVSSDSESSRLNSLDSLQSLKRKRVNFDDDSLLSPSTKKTKIDSEGIKNKEEIMKTEDKDGASDRTDKSEVD